MIDPLLHLAKQKTIALSAQIEAELASKGVGPTIQIIRVLQGRAAESLVALVVVDPEDPKAIRALQNEVKRYDEFVTELRGIIQDGIAYDRQITEDERQQLIDVLTTTPEGQQEAIELGLVEGIRDA